MKREHAELLNNDFWSAPQKSIMQFCSGVPFSRKARLPIKQGSLAPDEIPGGIKMIIKIEELIKGKKTYPKWHSNAEYELVSKILNKHQILVYYNTKGPIKRRVKRIFPQEIACDPCFLWVLGFLKGEGANSLGKSNYRRFTLTNTNPQLIQIVLEKLEEKELLHIADIPDAAFNIIHTKKPAESVKYWSQQLNLPKTKFKVYDDKNNTSDYGVCHLYLSDVLLRRIIDLMHEQVIYS